MRAFIFFVLLGLAIWFLGAVLMPNRTAGSDFGVPVKVEGIFIAPGSMSPVVILREIDGQRSLPIWVGITEAEVIRRRLADEKLPRPMTHDLLSNALDALGGRVRRIVVTEIKDGTYFARVDLLTEGDSLSLDARPSDAIAVALGSAAPIFVSRIVMDTAGDENLLPQGEGAPGGVQPEDVGCGIWCQPIDRELASAFGVEAGVLVADLSAEQAESAALKRGDVIVEVGGQAAGSVERVRELISALEPGKPVPMRVVRAGKATEIAFTCR